MTNKDRDGWRVVLGPGPLHEIRQQLSRWREDHGDVPDEDLRLDLIRAKGGDQLRVSRRVGLDAVDAGMPEHEAQAIAERVRASAPHIVTVEAEDAYFVVQVVQGSGDTWTLRDEQDWEWMQTRIEPD